MSANTTPTLIEDIEAVRRQLGIEKWIVTGVSWGSTLALTYSLQYPTVFWELPWRAGTTTSREEVQWITEGVGRIFPEAWDDFSKAAERRPGKRLVDAYARRLAGGDGFLRDGQEILSRVHELSGIPGYLIHGRRDISGPSSTPWKLHQRWNGSRLAIIENEGHGGPESMAALTPAVAEIAVRL